MRIWKMYGKPCRQLEITRAGRKAGTPDHNPLRASIEDFQRRSGLTVDGVLKPGGETEQAINKELESKRNSSPKYIKMKVGSKNYVCDQDKLSKNMVRTLKQSKEARERLGMFILPIDNTIAEQLPGVGTIRSAVTLGNFLGTKRGIDKAVQESCWEVEKQVVLFWG